MNRDSQKSKVYAAEFMLRSVLEASNVAPTIEVFGSTIVVPQELRFGSLGHVQKYVDLVLAHPEVNALFGNQSHRPISVRHRKGNASAHYCGGEIAIHHIEGKNTWAMREIVVLHEIAHHLAPGSGHGSEFAGAFLSLVQIFMGVEAHMLLLSCLEGEGAAWNLPKSREKIFA